MHRTWGKPIGGRTRGSFGAGEMINVEVSYTNVSYNQLSEENQSTLIEPPTR